MNDTRNEYKAMPYKNEPRYWKVYYRRWFSPFWTYFDVVIGDPEIAKARCIKHATPDPRKPVYFGRLP